MLIEPNEIMHITLLTNETLSRIDEEKMYLN